MAKFTVKNSYFMNLHDFLRDFAIKDFTESTLIGSWLSFKVYCYPNRIFPKPPKTDPIANTFSALRSDI